MALNCPTCKTLERNGEMLTVQLCDKDFLPSVHFAPECHQPLASVKSLWCCVDYFCQHGHGFII
ncbi:hypothetical protein DMH88_12315 [Escherichia coli]|nr:hypothetical protein [Escherichia coli]